MGRTKGERIDASEYVEKVRSRLEELPPRKSDEPASAVFLFVSFDLVNSTAFKDKVSYWPVVTSKFYELAARELKTLSPSFRLWKYVGDEVLFFRTVRDVNDLAKDVQNIFSAMRNTSRGIENAFPESRKFLSVKAAAWIARVDRVPSQDLATLLSQEQAKENLTANPSNLLVHVADDTDRNAIDFLGRDVDIGFRISKFAHRNKLVVSAHLARLLNLYAAPVNLPPHRMRIITYESLRGVWGGRPYPIVWYFDDWEKIAETFYYDEELGNDWVRDVVKKPPDKNIGNLERVFDDLNKADEVARLKVDIDTLPPFPDIEPQSRIPASKLAELHCVAVCVAPDGRILIARRPANKRTLPGKWEFGCAQLKINQTFQACIVEAYREDFGETVEDISPLPVATYVVEGDGRKTPGLIFVGRIARPDEVTRKFVVGKHSEVRWINRAEALAWPENEGVPDFRETANKVFQFLEHQGAGGTD